FELSPVLWRKIKPSLSAGRVQSVATRLVVERERERMAFVAADYWDITGTFAAEGGADGTQFTAKIATVDGARVATGSDFADHGRVHHHLPAAGSLAQAAPRRPPGDAGGAVAVRERLHHVHAYRFGHALGRGDPRVPRAGRRAVRLPVRAGQAALLPEQVAGGAGGARGDPPRGRSLPHPRRGGGPALR